jgi:hypothetical protein
MSFWGSQDLSPEIEDLFNAMNLCDFSKSLIISVNCFIIKSMIHLSNLELDDLSSLFLRKGFWDSSFQDTIIKVLSLRNSFLSSVKENHGLNEDYDISEHMIPTIFNEKIELLSESNLNILKYHYMTYWKAP